MCNTGNPCVFDPAVLVGRGWLGRAGAPASGETTAIIALLTKLGGSAFVMAPDARRLTRTGAVSRVQGAEPIPQTVYAAVNVRTRHAHQHRRIIALLQALLDG